MSWTVLKPLPNSTARPLASAQVRVSAKGDAKMVIYLSGTLYDELGQPPGAQVQVGEDDMAGHVRLDFAGADFKFSSFLKGGGRLTLPLIAGVAAKPSDTLQCKIIGQSKSELILKLPLAGWDAAALCRPSARPRSIATPSAPLKADDGRIDALGYLRSKGHKVDQLAGGRLQIDGELHSPDQVLRKINVHRGKADLLTVTLADLRL